MVRVSGTPNYVCPGWLITRTGQSPREMDLWVQVFPNPHGFLSRLEHSSVLCISPDPGCQAGSQNQVAIWMP